MSHNSHYKKEVKILTRIKRLLKDTDFPEEDIDDLLWQNNTSSPNDLIDLTDVLERNYKEKFGSITICPRWNSTRIR